MIYFDRSRREAWEKCPRARYYGYELDGRGISTVRTGRSEWPLMTGTGIHTGIELVAEGIDVDKAVSLGINNDYMQLPPADDERETFLRNEQIALIEALTRTWAIVTLPTFIETYEILAIEREEMVELAPGVSMMVRPDFEVRRKSDGAIFTWQLKSTKRCDERWVGQWALDQMTISEVLAVEARLAQWCHVVGSMYLTMPAPGGVHITDAPPKLSGVIIQGLLKGEQRQYPAGSGQWYHDSPLIWGWKNESGKVHPRGEWSARYEWTDDSGNHRLGKGWRKVPVWDAYPGGVKAWIGFLVESDPAALHEQIVTLPPILRNDHEVERWKESVTASEIRIRTDRTIINGHSTVAGINHELNVRFPMHTSHGNCLWPYKCQWYGICHEGLDPHDPQLFEPRTVNHSTEVIE